MSELISRRKVNYENIRYWLKQCVSPNQPFTAEQGAEEINFKFKLHQNITPHSLSMVLRGMIMIGEASVIGRIRLNPATSNTAKTVNLYKLKGEEKRKKVQEKNSSPVIYNDNKTLLPYCGSKGVVARGETCEHWRWGKCDAPPTKKCNCKCERWPRSLYRQHAALTLERRNLR